MPRNEPTPEMEALVQAYVEGHLSPEESARLLQLVRQDPALARLIVENVQMDGAIREIVGEREKELAAEPSRPPSRRWRLPRRPGGLGIGPLFGILAAASFLLVIALAVQGGRRPTPRPNGHRVARQDPTSPEPKPAPIPPEPARSEPPKPESPRPEPPRPESPKPESPRPEPPRPELPKPEPPKPEPTSPEPPRSDPPRPALPKPEPAPSIPAVARVERLEGEAHVWVDGKKSPLALSHDLLPGQRLETAAGRARLGFPDKTRVEADPQTLISDVKGAGGKRITVDRGEIQAWVTRQPRDEPLVFATPFGEATVRGTTLRIIVDPRAKSMRLEVTEGKVELKNLAGKAVLVESGHYAVASADPVIAARPDVKLLLEADGGVVINFGPERDAAVGLPDRWLGYKVFNDSAQEFDAARGYGWKDATPVPGDPPGRRPMAGTWDPNNKLQTDFMHATFVYGGSATEKVDWRLALPNGRYHVAVSVGTYQYDQAPHHVRIEGLLVIDRARTRRGEFLLRQAEVDVSDGDLTMVLGGHGTPKTSDDSVVNYIIVRRMKK